ncbi:MAG: SDR family oxidoreductase [Candidatus Omnitrophica bacterium]|nr:SDR family oxidoreductase [Candidatus Omnitrophota bacterium]
MKRVLITGGSGFIGSHLCDYFLGTDYEVVCVDNFLTGKRENVAHLKNEKRFKLLEQDISKRIEFPDALDLVLHFASPASPFDYHRFPIQTMKVGALGTHNALGLAKAKKASFLLASTSEVYGDPEVHPQQEEYWGHVNPIGPRGVYDEAKRFAEALTLAYYREHHVDVKIVRIFNTYGPRMQPNDGRAIPVFIAEALNGDPLTVFGSGSQTRSFCYVSDLVEGIYRLSQLNFHDPVNLGNPNEMTILELAEKIREITGSKSPIIFKELPQDDPKVRRPDISRAGKHLGWEPKVDLDTGLRKTVDYFAKLKRERGALVWQKQ